MGDKGGCVGIREGCVESMPAHRTAGTASYGVGFKFHPHLNLTKNLKPHLKQQTIEGQGFGAGL